MKKYNLSEIMKKAWEFVKSFGMSISSGLKRSWSEAKRAAGMEGYGKQASVLDGGAEERIIKTKYNTRGYYKDSVLEAFASADGGVEFRYSQSREFEVLAKTNRLVNVIFKVRSGALNGDIFGVNWENVQYVSGNTYGIKEEIKSHGFRWDRENKIWIRK